MTGTAHCSFCAKSEHDVATVIGGPNGVLICDECIELCKRTEDLRGLIDRAVAVLRATHPELAAALVADVLVEPGPGEDGELVPPGAETEMFPA